MTPGSKESPTKGKVQSLLAAGVVSIRVPSASNRAAATFAAQKRASFSSPP
eukprot:CAMPEP_0115130192 /NCGR_PEP_ID=MMETSP0227-20121206/52315_1 /TAXON_ID=89957 /ORGANISM="Polarella glacialis, Strain CCMP 1383" /LENGTH=50 /DNA_ID=CAMNT_0002535355 /DNA_START=61 /DNA_END=209 /DNA_ORIENTATION=-